MKLTKHYLLKLSIFLLFILLFLLTSCVEHYTGQFFSFPPGSKPHTNDWLYLGDITITSDKLPLTAKSNRNVNIKINDKNKRLFLNEDLTFNCASIRANIVWNEFEKIIIELYEEGNPYSEDEYNKQLIISGSNHLITLIYKYDPKNKKFIRDN